MLYYSLVNEIYVHCTCIIHQLDTWIVTDNSCIICTIKIYFKCIMISGDVQYNIILCLILCTI